MKSRNAIKSLAGNVLYEDASASLRECIENAVSADVCLDRTDLRGAMLVNASLDGARLRRACLKGANLMGANLSEALFDGADFSGAGLQNATLNHSSMCSCDFSEAAFGATDIRGSRIGGSTFSGRSVFSLDFTGVKDMAGCCYRTGAGGEAFPMSRPPVVITGLLAMIVFLDRHTLVDGRLHACGSFTAKNLDINIKKVV